jgi:hypothetical protein
MTTTAGSAGAIEKDGAAGDGAVADDGRVDSADVELARQLAEQASRACE